MICNPRRAALAVRPQGPRLRSTIASSALRTASTPGFTASANVALDTVVPEASKTNRARSLLPEPTGTRRKLIPLFRFVGIAAAIGSLITGTLDVRVWLPPAELFIAPVG